MKLQPLALALLGFATAITFAPAQDDILAATANFAPTLNFTNTYTEKPARSRDGTEIVATERFTAKIVANLTDFDPSELDANTPVTIAVGDFGFEGTLHDFLPVDRDGNSAEFTSATKGGTYFYTVEKLDRNGDPATDRHGNPLYAKVGTITLGWNATRLNVDVKIMDSGRAEVGSVVEGLGLIGIADDGERGGALNFANEGVPVSVTFGSAAGTSVSYAKGNAKTVYKKIDGEPTPLNSAGATGSADNAAPAVAVTIPSNDGGTGVIDFSGTVTDLAASTLPSSEWVGFVDVMVYVNDVDFVAPIPADDLTDASATGKHGFTFTNLPLDPGANTVVLVAIDESGNQTEITKTVQSTIAAFN